MIDYEYFDLFVRLTSLLNVFVTPSTILDLSILYGEIDIYVIGL